MGVEALLMTKVVEMFWWFLFFVEKGRNVFVVFCLLRPGHIEYGYLRTPMYQGDQVDVVHPSG